MRKHILSFTAASKAQKALTTARQKFPKVRLTLNQFGKLHSLMTGSTTADSTIVEIRTALA